MILPYRKILTVFILIHNFQEKKAKSFFMYTKSIYYMYIRNSLRFLFGIQVKVARFEKGVLDSQLFYAMESVRALG
eukprot:m.121772 g.121772  ORF g.121772 m.121772 type:complete len:76 (+) comp14405_c0_seq2:9-236(+)